MRKKRWLVVPDTHADAHDAAAWRVMLRFAKWWKPDGIIIIGDFVDCHHLSKHDKAAGALPFSAEIKAANKLLDTLNALGAKEKVFLAGNHEARLEKVLRESGLSDIVSWDSLLHLSENGWKYVEYGTVYQIGKLHFVHDVGFYGKNGTQQTLDFMGKSVVHGHSHRGRVIYQGDGMGEKHVAMCPGWLGDSEHTKLSYEKSVVKKKSWSQGFGTAEINSDGTFVVHVHPIL